MTRIVTQGVHLNLAKTKLRYSIGRDRPIETCVRRFTPMVRNAAGLLWAVLFGYIAVSMPMDMSNMTMRPVNGNVLTVVGIFAVVGLVGFLFITRVRPKRVDNSGV